MSAEVVAFPASSTPFPFPAQPEERQGEWRPARPAIRRYRLADMVRLLALDALERRSQIDKLRALAKLDRMPLPVTPRIWGGRVIRGPGGICAASLWDAAEVDAWLDRPGPHAPALAPPPLPTATRDALRHRARQLLAGAGA